MQPINAHTNIEFEPYAWIFEGKVLHNIVARVIYIISGKSTGPLSCATYCSQYISWQEIDILGEIEDGYLGVTSLIWEFNESMCSSSRHFLKAFKLKYN
jgi:hypothetical protein